MTFSILIAAYQAGPFLTEALSGVISQTHRDWELIVVEDGSHDETESLVREFAGRVSQKVRYENFGINRGVAAARNRLLDLAEGEAIAFLDADDFWLPEHLSTLANCLENGHPIACTPILVWDGGKQQEKEIYCPTPAQIGSPRIELFRASFIWTSTCVALLRETAKRVGHFDETLRIGEDRDYWFRALEGGRSLGCTSSPTCRYTKHAGSSMTQTLRVASDTVAFYRKYQYDKSIPSSLRKSRLAEALWIHGRLTRATNKAAARSLFREAVCVSPLSPRYWPYFFV